MKHLTLCGTNKVNDALCDCIARIKDLKTLRIPTNGLSFDSDSFHKILKLPNILASIVDIQFKFDDEISPGNVLCFLRQSRNLRKFSISQGFPFSVDERHYQEQFSRFLQNVTLNLDVGWTHYIRERDPLNIDPCLIIEKDN